MTARPELDDTTPAALDKTATQTKEPTAASADLAEGMRLGHFKIDRKLGAGGMGEVYLATDLALDRPVAIKVLPSGVASGSARERLIKEARAQARVHHPHVAHIYFIGEEAGRLYFAMEYVTGKTLADRIANGPLPVEDALALMRAAVLGLREAQRNGFTHRDIKPSNLMVDNHGMLKILDFGLAVGTAGQLSDGPVAQTSFAGTPLYMAPEQARPGARERDDQDAERAEARAIDFRADIYALGATLYHLVSGRPPFVADSVDQLISMHATAVRPSVPRGANPRTAITAIDALIAKMMAPAPADRFASYDELLRALELASVEHTRPAGMIVRGIATGVDLMLMILALVIVKGLVEVAAMLFSERVDGDIDPNLYGLPFAAAFCALAIARWGKTPGKALLELEVVSVATGQRPLLTQAFRRELAMVTIPILTGWAAFIARFLDLKEPTLEIVIFVCEAIGIGYLLTAGVLLLHAALRIPGKRAPWDRFAGTMVRYRTTRGSTGAVA